MERLTIVFDQDCGVCQASVAWLQRRDRDGRFSFVGNSSATLPIGVPREQTGETIFVVGDESKKIRSRADGIAWLFRSLSGWRAFGWRMSGAILQLPGLRQLANFSYSIFARHRHQVSAALGMNACEVPAKK